MQTIIPLLGIALFIVATYNDVTTFRIPNVLVASLALLGVTRLLVIGDPSVALYTVGTSVALLIVGFVAFWQGFIGGGDAKLITAAALLVGYHSLTGFLLSTAICGAVLSLPVIIMHWPSRRAKTKLYVPYGVAIAAAGGVTPCF